MCVAPYAVWVTIPLFSDSRGHAHYNLTIPALQGERDPALGRGEIPVAGSPFTFRGKAGRGSNKGI